jgi:hypothetical protein
MDVPRHGWRRIASAPAFRSAARGRRARLLLALALALGALAYPPSLALRFTKIGAEVSSRSSEFLFLAIAFTLALWVAERWAVDREPGRLYAAFLALASVLFVGGVIVGWAPWLRLPGSYLVVADSRSIEPEGLAAAQWARDELGPGNRLVGDRINLLLMGSYGQQRPVTSVSDGLPVAQAFLSPELGAAEAAILRSGGVRFVVVDRRLSTGLPLLGVYVELGEPGTFEHATPLDPAVLAKFDGAPGVSRVFDSGDIVVYDVGSLDPAQLHAGDAGETAGMAQ